MTDATETVFGAVTDVVRGVRGVTVATNAGTLEIRVLADDLLRLRALRRGQRASEHTVAIARVDWPEVSFEVEEGDDSVVVRAASASVRVSRADGTVDVTGADGHALLSGARIAWEGTKATLTWTQPAERSVTGCGEKAGHLERRGEPMQFWNAELPGYHAGFDPLYQSVPFYLAMDGPRAHGLYVDNTYHQWWNLGPMGTTDASIAVEDGALNVYLFTAPDPKAVLKRWTDLVGRIPMPPLWALGYQQSRWSYFPESTVRGIAAEFRERAIPCDVIWFDIDYMKDYKDFTWDPDRFPDPKALISDLKADGFQSIVILDPGVKVQDGYSVYEELRQAGFYVKNPDGTPFVGPVWPGDCLFPDFTNPACRAWWGDQYQTLVDQGVAGFWNDMNEPAVFEAEGHTMPLDVLHDGDGDPGDHRRYHNTYGMQMVRATYEGVKRARPNERAFVLTRSGFAGTHRYAATWTGDNRADWEGLWLSLPMVMNFGLSGQAISGPDIGGFMGDPTPELFTRWIQAGALFPFCRCHHAASKHEGEFDRTHAAAQEPWSHGGEYEAINRASIELRYRLLPYLYTLAEETSRTGIPMMRPLFLEYPDDPRCRGLDDQFLLGRDLLCAPVLEEGQTSRPVYLPPGQWYDFWTDERLEGGQEITVDAPLHRLPLYVRAGAILPMQPVVQHTGEMSAQPLIFRAYPDGGRAEGEVYEDDGISMDFQRGVSLRTRISLSIEGGEPRWETATEGAYINPRPPALHGVASVAD